MARMGQTARMAELDPSGLLALKELVAEMATQARQAHLVRLARQDQPEQPVSRAERVRKARRALSARLVYKGPPAPRVIKARRPKPAPWVTGVRS